jgi:hypothetical protein
MKADESVMFPAGVDAVGPVVEIEAAEELAGFSDSADPSRSGFLAYLARRLDKNEKKALDVLVTWLADYEAGPRAVRMGARTGRVGQVDTGRSSTPGSNGTERRAEVPTRRTGSRSKKNP